MLYHGDRFIRRQRWRFYRQFGQVAAALQTEPAIGCPFQALDRCLSTQYTPARSVQRPAAEMHEENFAVSRFDEVGMPGTLQRPVRIVFRGKHRPGGLPRSSGNNIHRTYTGAALR